MRLAVPGENLGNGHARRRFDLGVGVVEGQAEARGEPPADRGLARAHHADQHDRARSERGDERLGPRVARRGAGGRRVRLILGNDDHASS
jgi:hypothetical protein